MNPCYTNAACCGWGRTGSCNSPVMPIIAKAGDIIEIDAGLYVGDTAMWTAPNLTIRGVGGRAVLDAGGRAVQGKGIWLIRGSDIFIENIGFKNCRVRDKNGAGIRVEGDSLSVRNCLFWNNENGILCGGLKSIRTLTVRYSEFGFNGYLRTLRKKICHRIQQKGHTLPPNNHNKAGLNPRFLRKRPNPGPKRPDHGP